MTRGGPGRGEAGCRAGPATRPGGPVRRDGHPHRPGAAAPPPTPISLHLDHHRGQRVTKSVLYSPHFVTRCRHRRSLCNEIGAARRPEGGRGWAGLNPKPKAGQTSPQGPGRRPEAEAQAHRRGADGDVQVRTGPPGPTDAAAQRQPPTYVPRPPPARRSGPRCRGASPRPQARALALAARRSSPVRCSPAGPPDALARHRRRTGRSMTR